MHSISEIDLAEHIKIFSEAELHKLRKVFSCEIYFSTLPYFC